MTIFRSKKNGKLYVIYEIFKSFRMTYKRYQAVPLMDFYWGTSINSLDINDLKGFEVATYKG